MGNCRWFGEGLEKDWEGPGKGRGLDFGAAFALRELADFEVG
jgi:hypothetical protein